MHPCTASLLTADPRRDTRAPLHRHMQRASVLMVASSCSGSKPVATSMQCDTYGCHLSPGWAPMLPVCPRSSQRVKRLASSAMEQPMSTTTYLVMQVRGGTECQ